MSSYKRNSNGSIYVNEDSPLPSRSKNASIDVYALLARAEECGVTSDGIGENNKDISDSDFTIDYIGTDPYCMFRKELDTPLNMDDVTWLDCLDEDGVKYSVPVIFYLGADEEHLQGAFMIYLNDEGKLQVYIPKKGNCYNPDTHVLFVCDNMDERDDVFLESIGLRAEDLEKLKVDKSSVIEDASAHLLAYHENSNSDMKVSKINPKDSISEKSSLDF